MTKPEHIAELLKAATAAGHAVWFKGDDANHAACSLDGEIINFVLRPSEASPSEIAAVSAFIRGVEVLFVAYGDSGRDILNLVRGAVGRGQKGSWVDY